MTRSARIASRIASRRAVDSSLLIHTVNRIQQEFFGKDFHQRFTHAALSLAGSSKWQKWVEVGRGQILAVRPTPQGSTTVVELALDIEAEKLLLAILSSMDKSLATAFEPRIPENTDILKGLAVWLGKIIEEDSAYLKPEAWKSYAKDTAEVLNLWVEIDLKYRGPVVPATMRGNPADGVLAYFFLAFWLLMHRPCLPRASVWQAMYQLPGPVWHCSSSLTY